MTRSLRVLVVGAGPGGLALAQGLLRHGVDVAVYERDAALDTRPQGYRIGLEPAGWDALSTCLPPELFALAEATAGEALGMPTIVDHHLEVLEPAGPGAAGRTRPVDRAVLRHVLVRGLGDRVVLGRRVTGVEEQGERVRVRFDDGTGDVGDVVVGADGAFSAIRRLLHPDIGFVASDIVAAMGRTPWDDRFAALSPAMIQGPGLNVSVGPMVFRTPPALAAPGLPATESYQRWLLLLPPDHPAARPAGAVAGRVDETVSGAGQDARDTVLALIEDWHPLVRELVERSSAHNSWIVRPQLLDRPVPPWGVERVTLLGDAAHLTLPTGGNGLATALRDAAALTRRLATGSDVVADLRAYQREMLEYGRAAVERGVAQQRMFVPQPGSVR